MNQEAEIYLRDDYRNKNNQNERLIYIEWYIH